MLVFTFGLMVDDTKENGVRTNFMVMEPISGLMVECIQENMLWTKNMGLEVTNGQMGRNMKVSGKTGSNTDKENSLTRKENAESVYGKKDKG